MFQSNATDVRDLNERACSWMQRGLALLEENTPASLRESVHCFDEAIALRRQLPLAEHPWIRYGLIAGWMNRGDALTRLGGGENLADALCNYDEALLQLRELPMNESPLFKKRLAIAWLNRGVTLMAEGGPRAAVAALQSFDEALPAAQNLFASGYAEISETLACAWMNRANALLRLERPAANESMSAARNALSLLQKSEHQSASSAEMSLKVRHILCQALAHRLAGPELSAGTRDGLLAEAANIADDGMTLARHWTARGEKQFSALARDLFRFGCRVYQVHQPHFLTEFLLENLDPAESADAFESAEMHASAVEAVWHRFREIAQDGFKAIHTPAFEKLLSEMRDLHLTETRLAQLRERCSTWNDSPPVSF